MDLGFTHEVIAGTDPEGEKLYWSEIVHEPTATQKGDLFTKALDRVKFLAARDMVGVS